PSPRGLPSFPTRRSSDLIAGLSLGSIIAGHLGGHMSFRDAVRMTHLMPVIEDEEFAGTGLGVAFYYGVDMERFGEALREETAAGDRKSTRLNSSHVKISY